MSRQRALVTGASAGIGEAFAERLARDGYDLVVVARRRERLDALAERLTNETGSAVEVVVADLGTEEGIARVEAVAAADDRLALLVNNAGFGAYRPFAELDPAVASELVNVHVTSVVRVTRAAIPGMIARGSGGVITVASLLALSGTLPASPLPNRVTYAAGKAFQVAFSQLLAGELAGTGVRVMVCCPGVVATEFHTVQGMDMSVLPRMSSEDVVQAALAALEAGEVTCAPGVDDPELWTRLAEAQTGVIFASKPELAPRYRPTA